LRAARRTGWLDAACVALLIGWAVALAWGIARHRFDYDEFEHFYAVWRVNAGARPYHDFFEVHPLFLWYPLALFLRACVHLTFPLFGYRILTVAGHLAFVLALAANIALSFARLPDPDRLDRRPFALAVFLFAASFAVTAYLVEFRLDAWPNAVLFFAVYRHRKGAAPPFRAAFQLASIALLAIACSPKLVAFFGLYLLADLMRRADRRAHLAGLAAGAAGALLLLLLGLAAARISPVLAYRLGYRYHAVLNVQGGFGHGLARAILGQPALLALLASSLIGWLLVMGRRIATQPFELAVFGFLSLQAAFVGFSYAQYLAPWFLLGLVFFPYLELALRRWPAAHSVFLAAALVCAAGNVVQDLGVDLRADDTAEVVAFDGWARARVPPDATVAGPYSRLPIFRRNALAVNAYSVAPSGISTAEILHELKIAPWDALATDSAYDQQLETARPALIAEGGLVPAAQSAAMARYLARHAAEYQRTEGPFGPVYLLQP
jgi:hypothetical protein